MTTFQKRLVLIVGIAILTDKVCDYSRISQRTNHEAILAVIMFAAVISANDRLWSTKLFWALVVASFCLFILLLGCLNAFLPTSSITVWLVFVLCLGAGWALDGLANRVGTSRTRRR